MKRSFTAAAIASLAVCIGGAAARLARNGRSEAAAAAVKLRRSIQPCAGMQRFHPFATRSIRTRDRRMLT